VSGRLSAASHDVVLLARAGAADILRSRGLTIEEPSGHVLYARPRVVTALSELRVDEPPPELAILAVKAYDVAAAIADLAPACGPGTSVLALQNGLGSEEALAEVVGAERVVAGSFTLSVGVSQPGRIVQHTRSGGVALAEMERVAKRLPALTDAFAAAGFRVRACADWRAMKWSKLLLNLLTNASCAILEMTPAEVLSHPGLFALERAAFLEARRVMRRLGLRPTDIPGYPVRLLARAMGLPAPLARALVAGRAAGGRGQKMPSLALDLAAGKGRSEVGFLNGAVARAAGKCGLRAPVNASLASLLEGILAGTTDHEAFRHHPEALLRESGVGRSPATTVRGG